MNAGKVCGVIGALVLAACSGGVDPTASEAPTVGAEGAGPGVGSSTPPDGGVSIATPGLVDGRGASGTLDTSFGDGGRVILADAVFSAAFETDDGAIVVAGASGEDVIARRFDAEGEVDATFGEDGIAKLALARGAFANRIVRDAGGRILVSGRTGAPTKAAIARLLPNGQPDLGWGDAGVAALAPAAGDVDASDVAVRADGTVYVVSASIDAGSLVVSRLAVSGSIDATFGVDGHRVILAEGADVGAYRAGGSLSILPHDGGGIVAFATAREGGFGPVMSRFSANGQSQRDVALPVEPSTTASAPAFERDADGSSLLAYRGTRGSVWRVDDRLATDDTFGNAGRASGCEATPTAIVGTSDGKVVVASASPIRSTLQRFGRSGRIDAAFGDDGAVRVSFGAETRIASAFVRKDGRIVVVGSVGTSAFIARYWQ